MLQMINNRCKWLQINFNVNTYCMVSAINFVSMVLVSQENEAYNHNLI